MRVISYLKTLLDVCRQYAAQRMEEAPKAPKEVYIKFRPQPNAYICVALLYSTIPSIELDWLPQLGLCEARPHASHQVDGQNAWIAHWLEGEGQHVSWSKDWAIAVCDSEHP